MAIPLANSLRRRRLWLTTFSKSRAARNGQWRLCQPVPEPHQIDRYCGADISQMGLCLSDVARSPQVTAPHSLRERPFDACARRVSLFESRFRFLAPRLLQGAEFSFKLNAIKGLKGGAALIRLPRSGKLNLARRLWSLRNKRNHHVVTTLVVTYSGD